MNTIRYLAGLGLALLLLFPVGEAAAQTTGSVTTTEINLELSDTYVPDSTTTVITVTASYVTRSEASLRGPVTIAPTDATTVTVSVASTAFTSLYSSATTAAASGDFTAVTDFTIVIAAGETTNTGTFDLVTSDSSRGVDTAEGGVTLGVTGTATGFTVTPGAPGAPIVIVDSSGNPGYVDLTLSSESVAEGDGPTVVTVTATINTPGTSNSGNGGNTSVLISVAGAATNGATSGTDFTIVDDLTLTIPPVAANTAGTTTVTGAFTLTVADDAISEPDEILVVSGTSAGTRTLGVRPAILTITDNDMAAEAISVSLSPGTVSEASGVTTVTVTASAPAGSMPIAATTITVALGTTGTDAGTATSGASNDFTLSASSVELTFSGGEMSATETLVLTVIDDEEAEGDETLIFTATTAAINPSTGLVFDIANTMLTITDDDTPGVSITPTSLTIEKGASETYTVVLDTPPTGNVMVSISDSPTGLATVSPTSLSFSSANWSTAQTVTVTAAEDDDSEGGTVTLTHAVTGYGNVSAAADVVVMVTDKAVADAIEAIAPEVARASVSSVLGAVSDRIGSVIAAPAGAGIPGTSGTAGQFARLLARHEGGLNDGTLSLEDALAGSSLAAGQAETGMPVGVWVSADYEEFSSEIDGIGDWDGKQRSLHAGIDSHVTDTMLVGMAVSRSRGDIEFDDDATLDTEIRLVGISPYFGWHTPNGKRSVWATISHSRGDLEQSKSTPKVKTDLRITAVAIGGTFRMEPVNGFDLALKGDLSTANVSTDADGDLPATKADVNRIRAEIEAGVTKISDESSETTRSGTLGLRRDGGDGDSGTGVELGGQISWKPADHGLRVTGYGNLLAIHSSDLREWGVGGLIRYTGTRDRGVSFQLQPAYGVAASGTSRIWETELSELDPAREPEATLSLDTGYGIPVLAGTGLATPYAGQDLAEGGDRTLRFGTRFRTEGDFHLDLSAHRTAGNGQPETGLGILASLRW